MEFVALLILAAALFGLCFLIDKGFTRIFRGKKQHMSGLSVRLNKRYATVGLLMTVGGIACLIFGLGQGWLMPAAGGFITVVGVALVVYYMTFGVFYDDDGFVLTTFGKRSKTYCYGDIKAQQLYIASGNVVIELHMTDGRSVQLQATMPGVYSFLDKAFAMWLAQTERTLEECAFHNPEQSCWFPPLED